jgi:hypothetical protein
LHIDKILAARREPERDGAHRSIAALPPIYGLFFSSFDSGFVFAASSGFGMPNADNTEDCIVDSSSMF